MLQISNVLLADVRPTTGQHGTAACPTSPRHPNRLSVIHRRLPQRSRHRAYGSEILPEPRQYI